MVAKAKRRLLNIAWRGNPKSLSKLVSRADAANAARDWPAAEAGYAAALEIKPSLTAIWVQYGHSLKEQGRLEAAEQAYRRAVALDGSVADTHLQLGRVIKMQNRLDEARDCYQRAYRLDPQSEQCRREIEELAADQANSLNAEKRASDAWKDRFKVAEFRALNPELTSRVRTAEEAHAVFLQHGIDLLAPIANDAVFDPDFYRAWYPDVRAYTSVDAYRHWLFNGLAEGRCASEADVYQRKLIGRPAFPTNFDWVAYAKTMLPKPDGTSHTRLDAIEHLLMQGFAAGSPVPTLNDQPGQIFEHIADYCWGKGDRKTATEAMIKALEVMPDSGTFYHKLGDYYLEQNEHELAQNCFDKALSLNYHSIWTYLHLVENSVRVEDFARAYDDLAASRTTFSGEAVWRRKLQEVIDADFGQGIATNRAMLKSPTPDAADAQLVGVLERIANAYRELDDLPTRLPPSPDGHVVMFCLQLVPQCRHYRVEQRCEQFNELGIKYQMFPGDQSSKAREALVGARALFIYREPAWPENIRLILHAQAMGIPTFYEIDDLIFDAAHYPDPFSYYKGQISYESYIGLLQGRTLYRFAMSLCDSGIGSTQALCRHIAPVVRRGVCHHIPNGLDSRNRLYLDTPLPPTETEQTFIFYGSGTKAHNRNFNECAGQALVDVLTARPNARLVIVGYLDLDPSFSTVQEQIIRLDFSADVEAYWALLSEVDINLALLVLGEMNDCKSEIKWLEAAVAGVPSIVSPSATYREVLSDGVDALLAQSVDAMRTALLRLVDDPALRRRIGLAARQRALESYSLQATAARVAAILDEAHPGNATAPLATSPARRRTRILVVNVFFPPQTFGGATRVVRDNVDDLRLHYADEFELAVFTTDTGGPSNSSRVGSYHTIPVFRIWPELGENPEWDFNRQDVAAYFSLVLRAWKPDIVHFHCIQYLTGSLLEACTASRVPYVVTVHDGWWLSQHQFFLDEDCFLHQPSARGLLDERSSRALLPIMRRNHFLARQLGNATAVLAVSESFADLYRRAGIRNTKAIPNGLSPIFAPVMPRRTGRDGRVRIGHIAGWAYHKGIHLFQAALLQGNFNNLEAIVIDHTREESYKVEVVWGTTPVTILGKVRQEDVVGLYNLIDVLVAPSIWPESYGLVSREALRCGIWVVASNLGAIGEDIIEGENGFVVDVTNAKGVTEALVTIDCDPERFKVSPVRQPPIRFAREQVDDLAGLYRSITPTAG